MLLRRFIEDRGDNPESKAYTSGTEYLHLPVRLFAALSWSYDPLMEGEAPKKASEKDVQAIVSARKAVQQETWEERGIKGSYDYLQWLYAMSR